MTYHDKLSDPLWQKKRLEILNRDQFTCQICKKLGKKVNVHHIEYNGNPWDQEDRYLITLCDNCHKNEHKWRDLMEQRLLQQIKDKRLTWKQIETLTRILIYIDANQFDDLYFALAYPSSKNMLLDYGKRVKDEHP